MAYEATITGESTAGVVHYLVNSHEDGKYLRQFDAADVLADNAKFRVPGTDGSLIVRNGIVGHVIMMGVRYIVNTIEDLESTIATDLLMFSTEACTIEYQGISYLGCNLIPGSARKTSPIQSTGRAEDDVFVDLVLKFTEDRYGDEE